MKPLDDDDRARVLAWLDGELADPERGAFELRLAREPELARLVEELDAVDGLLRRRQAARARVLGRRRRTWGWTLALAAGVAAVLLARALLLAPHERTPQVELALLASPDSARGWIEEHPELAALHPPGLDELRGPGETSDIAAEAYLARAREAERALFAALQGPATSAVAGHFVLPLRCESECSLLVLGYPRRGSPTRLFPEHDAAQARLAPGEHLLPGERIVLQGAAERAALEYRPGFLVPLGSGGLEVVVALRSVSIDAALLAELDACLAGPDARHASAALLAGRGFELRSFDVREP